MMPSKPSATFFPTAADFRRWLEQYHTEMTELWVGFYKKSAGKSNITYPEAVEQALCFGWIDGVCNSLDSESYTNRFTPRKPRSNWSAINIARVEKLQAAGLMMPAGLAAFEKREESRSRVYSFEQKQPAELDDSMEKRFHASKKGWRFFQSQPPWYQRTSKHWVVSAKKEETRQKRLAQLIECSELGRPIPMLDRTKRK